LLRLKYDKEFIKEYGDNSYVEGKIVKKTGSSWWLVTLPTAKDEEISTQMLLAVHPEKGAT
jgi:hypothetical protein